MAVLDLPDHPNPSPNPNPDPSPNPNPDSSNSGKVCVDFCAGRGGKTLALLGQMARQGGGHVVAHDIDAGALGHLRGRALKAGIVLGSETPPKRGSKGKQRSRAARVVGGGQGQERQRHGEAVAPELWSDGGAPRPPKRQRKDAQGQSVLHLCVTAGCGMGGRGGGPTEAVGSKTGPESEGPTCTELVAQAVRGARAMQQQAVQEREHGTGWRGDTNAREEGAEGEGTGNLSEEGARRSHGGVGAHTEGAGGPEGGATTEQGGGGGAAGGEADVVLVDAPCSSLGTLRRGPNMRWGPLQPQTLGEP